MRLLGWTYLAAFGSLWRQILPLLGSHGIVPAVRFLDSMRPEFSFRLFMSVPSLFWISCSDSILLSACIVGCIAAVSLIIGWQSRPAAFLCWLLYLSIVNVGAPFLNFQWDALLLEVGFLALFSGSPLLVWSYRILLFRLMVESCLVKLFSGDPNWRNLHALRFHFFTQPLPTPFAYYAHNLPNWLLDGLTAATLVIELVAPMLLFFPRRSRYLAGGFLLLLQLTIILTGNYAFFNVLTMAICLWSFDDSLFHPLARLLHTKNVSAASTLSNLSRLLGSLILVFLIAVGCGQLLGVVNKSFARRIEANLHWMASFDLVNTYGLFAVMTTTRPEIILQGSDDQVQWLEYSFRYQPGELHRDLLWVAPHQPRLDWQMWFAAMGDINENPWVGNLIYRIMVGDPATTQLLAPAPFARPPRYMRALLYNYRFAPPAERKRTGEVWERSFERIWFGPVSLTGR